MVHEVSVELEVPFHDVDALHVVWHGHYYKYFEIARTALMRANNLAELSVVGMGYTLFVIETKCRHIAPLRLADRFRVTARVEDVDHRVHVSYRIHNLSQDRRCAKGYTMLATVDAEGRLLLETPGEIRDRLRT